MMLMTTKRKMALARAAFRCLSVGMAIDGERKVTRRGVSWVLDLREGIDLAIFLFGVFEPRTVRCYNAILKPGDVVLDIGANIGAHTLHFARAVGEQGRVLAMEPTQYAYARLLQNLSHNPDLSHRVIAIQAMLASDPAQNLEPHFYSSWPLTGDGRVHPLHQGLARATNDAKVSSVDQIVDDHALAKVDLIKLDVDGYEIDVLRGAEETLRRFRPRIILELAPYTLAERGKDPREIAEILNRQGYITNDLNENRVELSDALIAALPYGSSVNLVACPSKV